MSETPTALAADEVPSHRYDAARADEIETRWQAHWREAGTYHAPNPSGPLSDDPFGVADSPKLFIMDMFPYPSGAGLHVGHPLGYISTDVYARFKRMTGFNVLHTMGFDAFGLPAEEHARQTGVHPRENTEANIANMTRQLDRLGLGHDDRRSIATTDEAYYRWTQWIFSQIFNAWFDECQQKARPIAELEAEFAAGSRATPDGRSWAGLSKPYIFSSSATNAGSSPWAPRYTASDRVLVELLKLSPEDDPLKRAVASTSWPLSRAMTCSTGPPGAA